MTDAERIAACIAIIWPVVSAVASLIIGWRTDDEWVRLVERHPRTAACIRLLRAVGLDPVAAVRAIRMFFAHPPRSCGQAHAKDRADARRCHASSLPAGAPPPSSSSHAPTDARRRSQHDA